MKSTSDRDSVSVGNVAVFGDGWSDNIPLILSSSTAENFLFCALVGFDGMEAPCGDKTAADIFLIRMCRSQRGERSLVVDDTRWVVQ